MRMSLLAGFAAAALLAAPSLAVAQEPGGGETFGSLGWVTIPGNPLTSFDISWADTDLNLYFLSDRSNAAVDVFGIELNPGVFHIAGTGANAFAGNVPTCPIANACNGPNGVLTLTNPTTLSKELWTGDGPTMNPVCTTTCSTVKVFNSAGALTHVISTGGSFRADELCFVPPGNYPTGTVAHGIIQIANDAESPPYVSWIATDGPNAYKVIGQFQVTAVNGVNNATNGIEQCQFDPRTGFIYLNIPEVNGDGTDHFPGEVILIDPVPTVPVPIAFSLIDVTLCAGPQGMAIGPSTTKDILLGCNAPTNTGTGAMPILGVSNSVTIRNDTAAITAVLSGQGGSDEVWFDPVSVHYLLANGSLLPAQQLGITDALTYEQDQNIFVGFTGGTTRRSHSVAGWSGTPPGLGTSVAGVFLPVSAVGGTPTPPFTSTLCGAQAAQGCVAVFGATPLSSAVGDTADTN
jgi:hypothetical protein